MHAYVRNVLALSRAHTYVHHYIRYVVLTGNRYVRTHTYDAHSYSQQQAAKEFSKGPFEMLGNVFDGTCFSLWSLGFVSERDVDDVPPAVAEVEL